jgi:hypothetical protein
MRKFYSTLILLSIILFSCKQTDSKKSLASGMCDCFKSVEDKLSSETKDLIKKTGTAKDFEQAWKEEAAKLDSSKRVMVKKELNTLFMGGDKDYDFTKCMNKLDTTYFDKNLTDEQKKPQFKKAIEEMKLQNGCELGYLFLNMMMSLSDDAALKE